MDPSNAYCHILKGRWCYEVYNLSWVERQIATRLFATPPSATLEEAKSEFLEAERLAQNQWAVNAIFLARCYYAESNYESAVQWLNSANRILNQAIISTDDDNSQEVDENNSSSVEHVVPETVLRRSTSIEVFCQDQNNSSPQISPNRRIHSANPVLNTVSPLESIDPSFLEFLPGSHKSFEPNQPESSHESLKSNQQASVPFQSGNSGAYEFRLLKNIHVNQHFSFLLKLDHRNDPPSISRVPESVPHLLHLAKIPDTSNNHLMEGDISPPKLLRTELPTNVEEPSAQKV
ncbi:unnamed protein product [Rodentolepis nana]|uniref:Uncharacterized protein n=1 Tax=Rodentolepis nana TaxID=102285 RepID=A0A3P7U2G4_RODNA|nr:unnamed protein product [Rodentolepis nana]